MEIGGLAARRGPPTLAVRMLGFVQHAVVGPMSDTDISADFAAKGLTLVHRYFAHGVSHVCILIRQVTGNSNAARLSAFLRNVSDNISTLGGLGKKLKAGSNGERILVVPMTILLLGPTKVERTQKCSHFSRYIVWFQMLSIMFGRLRTPQITS